MDRAHGGQGAGRVLMIFDLVVIGILTLAVVVAASITRVVGWWDRRHPAEWHPTVERARIVPRHLFDWERD